MYIYEELDKQLEKAGLITIKERLEIGTPLDFMMAHRSVVDMKTFVEWVRLEYTECMAKVSREELEGISDNDFLYGQMSIAWSTMVNLRNALKGESKNEC